MSITLVTVANPGAASIADSTATAQLGGKQGDALVSELHGKYYTAAYRGRVFIGQTTTAGTTIPIITTTTATFALYNPLGSGVNVELISCDVMGTTTTVGSGAIGLGVVTGLTLAPTSLTALTPIPIPIGAGGVPQAKLYAQAVLAAATTSFIPLFAATAALGVVPVWHTDFDGKMILAPGTLVFLAGTAAQTGNPTVSRFDWAEWLP
jgi:hypothetical protein